MTDDFLFCTSTVLGDEIRYQLHFYNKILGTCIITRPSETSAYIGLIKIESEHRGYGWATKFYKIIEDEMKEQDVVMIELDAAELVKKNGKLTGLYESWGFEITGPGIVKYKEHQLVKEIPMRKILN